MKYNSKMNSDKLDLDLLLKLDLNRLQEFRDGPRKRSDLDLDSRSPSMRTHSLRLDLDLEKELN